MTRWLGCHNNEHLFAMHAQANWLCMPCGWNSSWKSQLTLKDNHGHFTPPASRPALKRRNACRIIQCILAVIWCDIWQNDSWGHKPVGKSLDEGLVWTGHGHPVVAVLWMTDAIRKAWQARDTNLHLPFLHGMWSWLQSSRYQGEVSATAKVFDLAVFEAVQLQPLNQGRYGKTDSIVDWWSSGWWSSLRFFEASRA